MQTYSKLLDYKDIDSKVQKFFKSENRYVINRDIFQSQIQSIQL